MGVTYDAGALIAAERGERGMWLRHEALLALRDVPTVPAPVVAQAWRGGPRQARLARLLGGCDIESMDSERARATGAIVARAGVSDVVDGFVAEGALRRGDLVITSDPGDIRRIAQTLGRHLEIEAP